jgi:hypothetical protein
VVGGVDRSVARARGAVDEFSEDVEVAAVAEFLVEDSEDHRAEGGGLVAGTTSTSSPEAGDVVPDAFEVLRVVLAERLAEDVRSQPTVVGQVGGQFDVL